MTALDPADDIAVRSLLARYCHRCDDGDVAGVVALFREGGVFTFAATVAEGSAALVEFFTATPAGKHITGNTVVECAGDGAVAVSDFVFLRSKDGRLIPALAGRYHDRLVRVDGQWRFGRRDAVLMESPA